MKKLFFLSILCFNISLCMAQGSTTLQGVVTQRETGETIVWAHLHFFQKETLVGEAVSNLEGQYIIALKAGTYRVEVQYKDFPKFQVPKIVVEEGKINRFPIEISQYITPGFDPEAYEERAVTTAVAMSKAPLPRAYTSEARAMKGKSAKPAPAGLPTTPPPPSAMTSDAVAIAYGRVETMTGGSSSAEAKDIPATYSAKTTKKEKTLSKNVLVHKDMETTRVALDANFTPFSTTGFKELTRLSELKKAEQEVEENVQAGKLTAGEWRDLDNWDYWLPLTTEDFEPFKQQWKFYPTQRYAVQLKGSQQQAVVDASVFLLGEKNDTIWAAKTDNQGKAELFANLYENKEIGQKLNLLVVFQGKNYRLGEAKIFSKNTINTLTIPVACQQNEVADVAFIVDATGSMGDEINYLKVELRDVIQRVKENNPTLNLRLGSVFYRDHGDAYLTQTSQFSTDITPTLRFIRQQQAGGGGDFPEAVYDALNESLNNLDWSANAVARIAFLVLDAPPHDDAKTVEGLQRVIRQAAEKGVKLIPVTASGIDKNTEYIMKAFAIATNGTYTFLTNHSGVGDNHIEVTADTYKVEHLNDLIVRLINQGVQSTACQTIEEPNLQRPITITEGDVSTGFDVNYFPNPMTDVVNIVTKITFDNVELLNTEGKIVRRLENLGIGTHQLDLS
ncbi:MAG: hypothetical protein RLZZ292_3665, partial [Bacteroidota bacterium]